MTTGAIDLNTTLHEGDASGTTEQVAARGYPQPATAREVPTPRPHRLDDNELSGFGRLATEPRTQTSRKSGEDYTVLRIAQNIRAIGSTVVTNYFVLVCFGGAHHIAKDLATGHEIYFRGTFIQEALDRPGQPPRLLNKVIVDYLRPVTRPARARSLREPRSLLVSRRCIAVILALFPFSVLQWGPVVTGSGHRPY